MKFEELLNKNYNNLNQNDLIICKYILYHKKECSNYTIDELGAKCNVSRTTLLRFSQKLGLKGYSELKIILKWDLESEEEEFSNLDIEIVCDNYKRLIQTMLEKNCDNICEAIYNANRIFVYGTGAVQINLARELRRIFLSANRFIIPVDGSGESKTLMGFLNENDLYILISSSGETEPVLTIAQNLKLRNIKTISITRLKDSTLAKLSTYNLYVSTLMLKTNFERGYETSTLFFILIEMLFLKYLNFTMTKEGKLEN